VKNELVKANTVPKGKKFLH